MSSLFACPSVVAARLRRSLVPAFLALFALANATPAALAQPTCGASFIIDNINDNEMSLTFVGDAVIAGNPITGSALTLTLINNPNQAGAAWWTDSMANPALGFDTTFVFQLNGASDGFAFVIQSDSSTAIGGSGSDLGYAGIPSSLAVEFDTFAFPGEIPEDHISVQSLGTAANSADDSASLAAVAIPDINDNLPHTVRILYQPGNLQVFLDDLLTPLLTLTLDLQNIDTKGTSLLTPDGCAWVGFTGATGGATATQQILTWTFEDQSTQCAVPGFTSFNFSDFLSPIGLSFLGDAQTAGAALSLTQMIEGQAAAAWFTDSRAVLAPGFDTTFVFQLDGVADGFAFVIQSRSPASIGGAGSDLGYAGIPSSLAVEFDTFAFTGEFPDDHISVQSLGPNFNSAEDSASLGSVGIPDINDNLPHTVRILYTPPLLDIFLDDLITPALSLTLDLQNIDGLGASVLTPDGCAWIGFTGSTGLASANQDILSWSFQQSASQCLPPGITGILINGFTIPAPGELLFELLGVSGSQPLSFQWTRNGVPLTDGGNISGASTGRLVISPTTTDDSGQYDVALSNPCGGLGTGLSFLVQCSGDANASNSTDFSDITAILSNWGAVYSPALPTGPGDANQNGVVNFEDITTVLSNWGHICQ